MENIKELIIKSVDDYLESESIEAVVTTDTVLFGAESTLDSIGLVNIIIDIESKLANLGYRISLTSDSAMSRRRSPFRTVGTLADFILEQINSKGAHDE